jgi:hypothetical protein
MSLGAHLTELVSLFNAEKTDLPAGAIDRNCVFRLNGRAYHETLGRPAEDPLVRLIGCGPAAYRLLLTAIRYAVAQPRIVLGPLGDPSRSRRGASSLTARAVLTGALRGSAVPLRAECALALKGDAHGHVQEIAVTMGDADVELIVAARGR